MIKLDVSTTNNEYTLLICAGNICKINTSDNDVVWVRYFDCGEYRSVVVTNTIEDLQKQLFVDKHGKLPAKGAL